MVFLSNSILCLPGPIIGDVRSNILALRSESWLLAKHNNITKTIKASQLCITLFLPHSKNIFNNNAGSSAQKNSLTIPASSSTGSASTN